MNPQGWGEDCPPSPLPLPRARSLPSGDRYPFGDPVTVLPTGWLRILLLNINGFPLAKDSSKHTRLQNMLRQHSVDIALLTEINVCWRLARADSQMRWVRDWFDGFHESTADNVTFPATKTHLHGGVSVWTMNETSHWAHRRGRDPTGLGRWSWTLYRGRNNVWLRVVAAYRPVHSSGDTSVWVQHETYFQRKQQERNPRQAFVDDLLDDIDKWVAEGNQLIIGIDLNEDIRTAQFSRELKRRGIHEAITTRHGTGGPATYKDGSNPIDGLFCSTDLLQFPCRYTMEYLDHCALSIDVPMTTVFGHELPPIVRPAARRLQCKDPRIIAKYNADLSHMLQASKILDKIHLMH